MENADQSKITKLLDKPIKLSYEKTMNSVLGFNGIQFWLWYWVLYSI